MGVLILVEIAKYVEYRVDIVKNTKYKNKFYDNCFLFPTSIINACANLLSPPCVIYLRFILSIDELTSDRIKSELLQYYPYIYFTKMFKN